MTGQAKLRGIALALSSLVLAMMAASAGGQQSAPATTPASTPAGIMLVEVHREEGFSSDQYFWTRLGDDNGNTLFYFTGATSDQGAGGDEFRPLLAAPGAVAFDDWTLVSRQGEAQWAYQSHPLYTWSNETEPGQAAVNAALYGTGPNGEQPLLVNRGGAPLPPEGWQVARFTPAVSAILPDGIDLRLIDSGQGTVLTDHQGYSLYSFDDGSGSPESACSAQACLDQWTLVAAPALAGGLGAFSIIDRNDGSRQWAYQGRPLFRFKGDLLPGDIHGRDAHPNLALALLKRNFRPEAVEVLPQPGYGDIFTLGGRTLYFGSAFEKYWGGRNLRGSFEIAYHKGKRLGGNACISSECLKTWQPFAAPAAARSSGFWEVVDRADGSRQWAYKGFALYTHSDDQARGEMHGHSLYDIADVDGDLEAIARTKLLAEVGNAMGGAGIYWSVAKP